MRGCGEHGAHQIIITTNNNNDGDQEQADPPPGGPYESCIGATCSRSPSPIRREFWESNKPLPDIVVKRRAQALRNKQKQQQDGGGGESRVTLPRQGRPRCRITQSRDPLFVYNDGSEAGSSIEVSIGGGRDRTPEPRRPRSRQRTPEHGNLTLDLEVNDGNSNDGGCIVPSDPNSPRSVKFSLPNSPRVVVVNDCASLCCPAVRSRSPSPSPSCHFQDRACSPIVRSRSPSPCMRQDNRCHSRSSSLGSVEIHNENAEGCMNVDWVNDGFVNIRTSSGESDRCTPPQLCTPCPVVSCRTRSQTPTPRCRSRSPPSASRTSGRSSSQNSIEICSGDGDIVFNWEGNDINLHVDLENSDACSTPRRVNVRWNRAPSKSRSRSGSPRTPRPPWDNIVIPCGKGALRLNRPPPPVRKSRSPSRSRSGSPSSRCKTPRRSSSQGSIEIQSSDENKPCVKVNWDYPSESVDSHSTSGSPQRRDCCTPCRSRSTTPARSRCSTPKSRSKSPRGSGRQKRGTEIRSACPSGPQVTIHRDYLSTEECSSEAPRTPRVIKCSSRTATPPKTTSIVSTPVSPCAPCPPVSNGCSCHQRCCCDGGCVRTSCHRGGHHNSGVVNNCTHCPQMHCQSECASSVTSINTDPGCGTSTIDRHIHCSESPCHWDCTCHHHHRHHHHLPHHHHVPDPEPYCTQFGPQAGDIVVRASQRKSCPYSGNDDGQVDFFSCTTSCGLREGDTIVRLGKFDSSGRWCASDIVGMYMLGSCGMWIFLGEEEGHECLKPLQADQHQVVRTVNKWFRPRLGDLVIHPLPGPHSFYFWNPKKRLECDDIHLLLRSYIGRPQVEDEKHNIACCTSGHLPVGYAELYVQVRSQWLFLGRDDHMFTECEILGS